MSNKLYLVPVVFFSLLFSALFGSCTSTAEKKHILIIHSYEANFPAYKEMKKIIANRLRKRDIQAEIHSYYLDCEQNQEKKQKQALFDKINELSSWNPDIIMTFDDQALQILLTCNHPSVKSTPVVFSGVNYPNIPFIQKYPNITGFHDKPDYQTNIKLIERLIGKCIVVRVTDNQYIDQVIMNDMDEQVRDICKTNDLYSYDKIRISGKNGISPDSKKKIKPDAMYISTVDGKSTRSLVKGLGENYYNKAYLATKRDYLALSLGRFSSFPGFSVIYEMIGSNSGVAGGFVTPLEELTVLAINRVADILNGVPPTDFTQITETDKAYIFDYKVLEHWGIDKDRLPSGSLFVNRPFHVKYRTYILFLCIIVGISLTIIIVYQRILYKKENARKKEIQENLKQEKEFLSFALESGNIFTFRYKNGIFMFDKEFYRYLNIPEEPISADRFEEAIHPDEREDFEDNRYKLDHGFTSRQITRRRYNFNKKEYLWWEFRYAQNSTAHTPNEANQVEVNGLCLNIQRIKDTEQELINARKKAEESDHMKSVFLANMSHEIRTPLNAIVGFSQLLISPEMQLEENEKEEFIGLINKNSDLLLKLINDILDLSRIESGHISFTYETCNLSQLMDDVYNTHKLLMPEGVELRKKVPETPAIISIDCLRLTQVLTNFINNATKFTTEGYIEIEYEYSADNQFILLSVRDTGKGIPKEKIEQVFKRFLKLDEFAKGTGLGLAISQSIIKTFNGTILLESDEGKGCKFTVSLPYKPAI